MDATPIRLGQEFRGYAGQTERARRRVTAACEALREVALGGTAVGTGVNTNREFASRTLAYLGKAEKVQVQETANHFQAQSTIDAIVEASGQLRTVATSLVKIANDIRLMGSGPRAGLYELALLALQPGSSIMPGKVNPVIPETRHPGRCARRRERCHDRNVRPVGLFRTEHHDAPCRLRAA